jgi:hypothetical protein
MGAPPPTQPAAEPGGNAQNSLGTIAYVDPSNPTPNINVVRPNLYTPAVAAHESAHNWQNSRNQDFVSNIRANEPTTPSLSDYNYGGVPGLTANPLKSIGNYNPEQQASMVGDLTQAQSQLKPGMAPAQLQAWDNKKNALERPIQQLKDIPAPDNSLASRADAWLNQRPIGQMLSNHGASNPFELVKGIFSPPSMPTAPQAIPGAPSVALGYANPSKLAR